MLLQLVSGVSNLQVSHKGASKSLWCGRACGSGHTKIHSLSGVVVGNGCSHLFGL